eukprot:6614726-Lingulodinium_polyedra.AAC.1
MANTSRANGRGNGGGCANAKRGGERPKRARLANRRIENTCHSSRRCQTTRMPRNRTKHGPAC